MCASNHRSCNCMLLNDLHRLFDPLSLFVGFSVFLARFTTHKRFISNIYFVSNFWFGRPLTRGIETEFKATKVL